MAKNDPVDIVFNIIKIAIAIVIGALILKALLPALFS